MVEVFREVRRVMRDDGTLWLNMGDGYSGGNAGGTYNPETWKPTDGSGGNSSWGKRQQRTERILGLRSKNLIGMPWRLALALQAEGWYLRSDIIWAKPNPMPESCTDRPTKSHEHLFLLTVKPRYFYDAHAVREKGVPSGWARQRAAGKDTWDYCRTPERIAATGQDCEGSTCVDGTRNLRDVWTIPTEAFPGAHFATFPRRLVEPCIKAGTSDKGCCPECGRPWVRVVEKERVATRPARNSKIKVPGGWDTGPGSHGTYHRDGRGQPEYRDASEVGNRDPARHVSTSQTLGWRPGCECGGYPVVDPCTVFDPFCGSGTSGVVATQLGRRFVGIELNPEYAEMARRRIANPEPQPAIVDVPGQEMLFELETQR